MPDPENPIGCGHCMVAFPQGVTNAHGLSGVNPRFFSLYNGTDISSTTTVTPGYKLDFPGTAGNCATCHVPGAAANRPFTADMNDLTGVETEGVLCDFCQSVRRVPEPCHVPTDFPGRHTILAVTATDEQRQTLVQLSGPTVPDWGGTQAGLPGKAFAKVLRDVETGESLVVSYWKQALIVSDNRIARPKATSTS